VLNHPIFVNRKNEKKIKKLITAHITIKREEKKTEYASGGPLAAKIYSNMLRNITDIILRQHDCLKNVFLVSNYTTKFQ